jgi:hypothetical protein
MARYTVFTLVQLSKKNSAKNPAKNPAQLFRQEKLLFAAADWTGVCQNGI